MDTREGASENTALIAAIRQLSETWRKKLTDTGRRNAALYFKHLKAGTLRLPNVDSEGILGVVDGGKSLDLTEAMEWTPDCQKRITTIRSKAKENEEERGIQTMFLALGMATWKSADGGKDPKAPVFLIPVSVTEHAKHVTLNRTGDLVVNRIMLQAWEEDHKHTPEIFDNDDVSEIGILRALEQVHDAGKSLEAFSLSAECYLGNFSFAKMAMVEDLKRNEGLLLENRLVSAIAGDHTAMDSIKNDAGTIEREDLDDIDPFNEVVILEADEYQRQAIHSLVRFNADGVIDGPPGTGKSQTIANLIASLVADRKRVLFVAEKRAALDAVLNRLTAAGLEDIVLDLHGADARRKVVYDRLRFRNEKARIAEAPPSTTPVKNLKQLRSKLNAYYRAVNKVMDGCGLNVRDVISRLGKLKPQAVAQTIWYDDLSEMNSELHDEAQNAIAKLATFPDLFRRSPDALWSRAEFAAPSEAAEAIRFVTESRTNIRKIREHLSPIEKITDRRLETFADLAWAHEVACEVYSLRGCFSDSVTIVDPHNLLQQLEPAKRGPLHHLWSYITDKTYRLALKAIRAYSKEPALAVSGLVERMEEFARLPAALRSEQSFKTITDAYVQSIDEQWGKIKDIRETLFDRTGEPLSSDLNAAGDLLARLESAHRDARRIHEIREAESFLQESGYAELVDELRKTPLSPELWREIADHAWLRSFLERAKADEPMLGGFSREMFEKLRTEFQDLDRKQIGRSRIVVRRGATDAYVQALNDKHDQAILFKAELLKKARNLPIRKLVERTGDVMTALCPCWMASPLSVSQLLPGKKLFDVVIFDEASQVMPEDAMPAIMRAKRAVVAGDPKQLPPTAFFASGSSDPEDDDEEPEQDSDLVPVGIAGMESILDVMTTFCAPQSLNIHYRSLDESLIRFSNHEFYHDRLITFPSADKNGRGIEHILVEGPHNDGEELSSSVEISKVVDLVFEHAETDPDETLGVIALGIKHAKRIEAAISQRRQTRPDLDEFFSRENVNESFFVKNLERVQGDERDAVILSFGYAKDGTGNLRNRLGPINHSGGERRLNVAVTRAKTRMNVVSSFTENDMDPTRFTSIGAQVLSRYLGYARSGGKRLSDVKETDVEMNEFEIDVMDTLSSKGLRLVPQLGVSGYRLDFAVLHPNVPNKYVLAIECDGAPYHSSKTARDRDRLRQTHLESRGWRFHRIWSLDWYEHRADEIDRTLRAYDAAVADADAPTIVENDPGASSDDRRPAGRKERPEKPPIGRYPNITDYDTSEIRRVFDWISSDGILRSDDEMIAEAVPVLGFARRGRLIDERLRSILIRWQTTRTQF